MIYSHNLLAVDIQILYNLTHTCDNFTQFILWLADIW